MVEIKLKKLLISLGLIFMAGTCSAKEDTREATIAKLELLLEATQNLKMSDDITNKIVRTIQFELDYEKRCLYLELGKQAYDARKGVK